MPDSKRPKRNETKKFVSRRIKKGQREGAKSGVGRRERMKRGRGMQDREERSKGIEILIADDFTIIKPTTTFKLAKHEA